LYKTKFCDREFIIEIKSSKTSPAKIKKLYEDWLMNKAKSLFKHIMDEYSEILGVKTRRIVVKNLKGDGAV
jgi:predicted metal-dependent hydrolase